MNTTGKTKQSARALPFRAHGGAAVIRRNRSLLEVLATPRTVEGRYIGQCVHTWAPPGKRSQRCTQCGAMCLRDKHGVIDSFATYIARAS